MSLKKKSYKKSYCTIIIFCILIFGLTLTTFIVPSQIFSENENRMLAQKPEIRADNVLNGEFAIDYEDYLTDQFVLRNQWITLKTSVEKILMKKESKDIYFADDDYLIEKHTGSFTSDLAKKNIKILKEFIDSYEQQFGKDHMSVMIVPNAVDILQDKLPPYASPYNEKDYLDEIAKSLPDNIFVDTSLILQKHNDEELYYRTDHHWKTQAAFYAYQQWAKQYKLTVPEISDYEIKTVTNCFEGTIQSKLGIKTVNDTIELFLPKKRMSYTIYEKDSNEIKNSFYDYAALDIKDKYSIYFGGNHSFLSIQTELDNHRKILVIKDSYANCFIPFMAGEFQQIDVLDIRYSNQKLSQLIDSGQYTDLLILYNASGFAEDMTITKLMN